MNLIERKYCAISGKNDMEHLYSFYQFPVFMGCVNQAVEADIKEDMSWWISRSSGLIQLNKLLPLEVLYPESHGSGAVGTLWNQHHRAFALFLHQKSPSSVLELGGAHGILAKEFNQFADIPWTIVEPNPVPVEGCKAHYIKGFFDNKFNYDEAFDAVVHSHVFEHIYHPDQFMNHLGIFMDEGKQLVFSLPNMQIMLERKYTNCINFEHTIFLTEDYIEFLLAKHGFKLVAKEYFMDDHSIFYAAVRDSSVTPMDLPKDLYKKNKQLYMNYISYHKELILDFNKKMRELKHPLYLFGAHVFTQYLISFGLDMNCIISLLDNDIRKHGKRLYGTNLMVQSPCVLKNIEHPVILLRAGVHNQGIKEDILENINPFVTFLE
ncbi:MAG TPA: class I SAM-dependent methyltransferase [Gammaproteobacteria bacterium]|nr:class I SAM-dependent methyltransferase [Gammaproteobacteria bacterium]